MTCRKFDSQWLITGMKSSTKDAYFSYVFYVRLIIAKQNFQEFELMSTNEKGITNL